MVGVGLNPTKARKFKVNDEEGNVMCFRPSAVLWKRA